MGGDYTRFTFDPKQHRASVLMQQGRVQLDADLNEMAGIIDRYRRSEAYDLIGRTGVSRLSMAPGATTPEAFLIRRQGGTYTIGRGRIYVDGIQAENHGIGAAQVDEVLDELRGARWTPVNRQPHLGSADPQKVLSTGRHLAYLDVWRREVTAVEDAGIVEKAVGVDTSTREQTAWQVRVLPTRLPDGTTCATDWSTIPAWNQATRRSAARLTSRATQAIAPSDPCVVAPSAGYRGLENRLYRVEVHDDGTSGALTLKWSRDNASVAARVTGIDAAGLIIGVERVGRDRIMRFATGQWVELTDDEHEYDGLPGVMARVASADDVNSTVTLTAAVPAGSIDTTRNPRIRRWDQTTGLTAQGLIQVTAFPATVNLEDGVRVELRLVGGGNARVGDYWVFAARTADASVEQLTQAPPRGILHHYTPLALVRGTEILDCRKIFPALPAETKSCDCTVCVSAEEQQQDPSALQRAVDKVGAQGGKVCLEAGVYPLPQPLDIRDARSLRVEGKGYRTVLLYGGDGAAVTVMGTKDVVVADLSVVTLGGRAGEPSFCIALRDTLRTRIDRCYLVEDFWLMISALVSTRSEEPGELAKLRRDGLSGGMAIALSGVVTDTAIGDCVLLGETGVGGLVPGRTRQIEVDDLDEDGDLVDDSKLEFAAGYALTVRLVIEANLLACVRAGIDFGTVAGIASEIGDFKPRGITLHAGETRVVHNDVLGCLQTGIAMLGRVLATAVAKTTLLPAGGRLDVRGNTLVVLGDGINVRGDRTRVADNDVAGMYDEGMTGIVVNRRLSVGGVSGCVISGNRIAGMALGDGIEIGPGDDLRVAANSIDSVGRDGITARMSRQSSPEIVIVDNEVTGTGELGVREDRRAAGILVVGAEGVDVSQNLVRRVAVKDTGEAELAGILMLGCDRMRIVSNQLYEIGPSADFGGTATGIEVVGEWDRLDVIDNSVQAPLDSDQGSRWHAITIGAVRELERIAGPVTRRRALRVPAGAADEERAIIGAMRGLARHSPWVVVRSEDERPWLVTERSVEPFEPGRSLTAVSGNLFDARGRAEAVLIFTSGNLSFQDNRCVLASAERGTPVARLYAIGAVIVNANHVEGDKLLSLEIQTSMPPAGQQPHATVVGNIASGDITLNAAQLQNPWAPLNLTG